MEAETTTRGFSGDRLPRWLLGLAPLALIVVAVLIFVALDAPGLGERNGVPVEEIVVERTTLRDGLVELGLRNDGPDALTVAQVTVNDAFIPFTADDGTVLGRLGSTTLTIPYPWIEGEAYEIGVITSTGGTVLHEIPVAAETPEADADFYGLMALLGIYVGVIPVAMGMLFLPWVRRIDASWVRFLLALTIGLLAFLGIDAALEGLEIGATAPGSFGGTALVFVGALFAYLALAGVDALLARKRESARTAGGSGEYLALLVAVGIGLHNLGEGLAIGSSYASGALALGTFLVIGFALHNTTEGLAIVAPLADRRPGLGRLLGLGLIAGGPAVLGAWIGASAFNPSLAAFLFGLGVGAIAQVIVQLLPSIRDRSSKTLNAVSVGGLLTGLVVMYATGLLVSV